MRRLLAELHRRDRVLACVGWLHWGLAAAMLVALVLDERQVLGLSVWVKPLKFAVSIAIYLWTLAWLLPAAPGPAWCKRLIRYGASLAMIVEITCIAGQSWRGTASHFNNDSPLDVAVFATMGLFILFNTLLELLLAALYMRPNPALPPAYLWGIRWGLAGAIFSAAVGGLMLRNQGHTVGAIDGGPGLWLVNWSTEAGDLRVAHALGLHALQLLPLIGYALGRHLPARASVVALTGMAVVYLAVSIAVLWQALAGEPLWPAGRGPSLNIAAEIGRAADQQDVVRAWSRDVRGLPGLFTISSWATQTRSASEGGGGATRETTLACASG